MNALKKIIKIIEVLIFMVLVGFFVVIVSPYLPTKKYLVSYVIPTGSMEPTVKVGSVVFVQPVNSSELQKGDIIAFKSPLNPKDTILHRIHEVSSNDPLTFITKGDGNKSPDIWEVIGPNVIGKYKFTIPYIGYAGVYMKTPLGFALIVGLPALIFILMQVFEIRKAINREIEKRIEERLKEKSNSINIVTLAILIPVSTLFLVSLSPAAYALYADSVSVNSITIKIADFDTVEKGDIVINEIMWMGTQKNPGAGDKEDEWIELRNMTSRTIDISGYEIENAGAGESKIEISDGSVIQPNGYLLIAAKQRNNSELNVTINVVRSNMGLDDGGEVLILKTSNGEEIDKTPGGSWPAGDEEGNKKYSMERDSDPGDGTDSDNWHTCNTDSSGHDCTSTDFWKTAGLNYGTPGSKNYSEEEKDSKKETGRNGDSRKEKIDVEEKVLQQPVITAPDIPSLSDATENLDNEEAVPPESNSVCTDQNVIPVPDPADEGEEVLDSTESTEGQNTPTENQEEDESSEDRNTTDVAESDPVDDEEDAKESEDLPEKEEHADELEDDTSGEKEIGDE